MLLVIIMMPMAITPAYAFDDYPDYIEDGTDAKGIMARGSGEVYVAKESFEFNILNLPSMSGTNEKYKSRLTTKYTLVNPTDKDASFKIDIPINETIEYSALTKYNYKFYLNGEKITPVERSSFKENYNSLFDEARDLALLADDYIYDDFFNNEATVTKYTVKVEGATETDPANLQMTMHFPKEDMGVRYLLINSSQIIKEISDEAEEFDLTLTRMENGSYEVYLIGKPYEEMPSWTLYDANKQPAEGSATMVENGTLSFSELVYSSKIYQTDISDMDWYNMVVSDFMLARENNHFVGNLSAHKSQYLNNTWLWYEIEVSIKAGESIDLTLEQPVYPTVDTEYDSYTYEFGALISSMPHASTASIEVKVNTEYYLIDCSTDGNATEGGYQFSFENASEVEEGRFSFTLCESQNPTKPKEGLLKRIGNAILLIILVILDFLFSIVQAIAELFK